MWNFQWQTLFEFPQDSKGPHSRHFWCLISHATFQLQPQLWGIVLWKFRITWQNLTWNAEVQSFFCVLPSRPFLSCQSLLGSCKNSLEMSGSWYAWSQPQLTGWESVDEFPSPSSVRWVLCTHVWSSQPRGIESLWPTAGTPIMYPYLVFLPACLAFPHSSLPHLGSPAEWTTCICPVSGSAFRGNQTGFTGPKTLKNGS